MARHSWLIGLVVGIGTLADVEAQSPQVHVSAPYQGINDSFYEMYGTRWFLNRAGPNGNFFANFGGGAIPPFGGFDPNSGARLGVGGRAFNTGFGFNFVASQGSSRSIVSSTPSVTFMAPGGGSFRSQSFRPFVTGIIPVVGDGGLQAVPPLWVDPTYVNGLRRLQQMREAKRQQQFRELEEQVRQRPPPSQQNDDPPLILK